MTPTWTSSAISAGWWACEVLATIPMTSGDGETTMRHLATRACAPVMAALRAEDSNHQSMATNAILITGVRTDRR